MTPRDLHRTFVGRSFKLEISGSHRPPVVIEDDGQRRFRPLPDGAPDPVPMWLRELRRDSREFIV